MTSAILLGMLSTSDLRYSESAIWDFNRQTIGGGAAVGGDEAAEGTLRHLEAGPDGSQTGSHLPQLQSHPFSSLVHCFALIWVTVKNVTSNCPRPGSFENHACK